MKLFRRRDERGQTLVEFALIAPLFFMMIFGIMEGANIFHTWEAVQHSAEMGARYAVTGRDSCSSGGSGRTGCITSEARRGLSHLPNGPSSTVSTQWWDYPTYASGGSGAGSPCDAVEVRVNYSYPMRFPVVQSVVSNITLTGRARVVNEPFGKCR